MKSIPEEQERILMPTKPTEGMLSPFYECPPEELELAYAAMLVIAKHQALAERQDSQALPERSALAILATFAHEVYIGAIRPTEMEHAARTALMRTDMLGFEKVRALATPSSTQAAPVQPSDAQMEQIADAIWGAQKKRLPMTAAIEFARAVLALAAPQAAEARKP